MRLSWRVGVESGEEVCHIVQVIGLSEMDDLLWIE